MGLLHRAILPGLSVVIASKKDGNQSFYVDFSLLNEIIVADRYPLPNKEELLEKLMSSSNSIALELFTGYWQVPLGESVRDIKRSSCRLRSCEFEIIPFGQINAPPPFQNDEPNTRRHSVY